MDSSRAPFYKETEALEGLKDFDQGHTSGGRQSQDSDLALSLLIYPSSLYCLPALLGALHGCAWLM